MSETRPMTLIRHEGDAPSEAGLCGRRTRLISREDRGVAAMAHTIEVTRSRLHYHKITTEIYYVLEGEGTVSLDGVDHPVRQGSILHIPPGVVHGGKGRMRVLVLGVPCIDDDDVHFPEAVRNGE